MVGVPRGNRCNIRDTPGWALGRLELVLYSWGCRGTPLCCLVRQSDGGAMAAGLSMKLWVQLLLPICYLMSPWKHFLSHTYAPVGLNLSFGGEVGPKAISTPKSLSGPILGEVGPKAISTPKSFSGPIPGEVGPKAISTPKSLSGPFPGEVGPKAISTPKSLSGPIPSEGPFQC